MMPSNNKSGPEPVFTARMTYSPEAVRRLTNLQYNSFHFGEKAMQILCGIILLLIGIYLKANRIGIISVACGCFILVSSNLKPKMLADQLCRQYGDQFPSLEYYFSDTGLSTQQVREETPYASMIRLIDDGSFLFLFQSQTTVYMLEKETVAGQGAAEELKAFLQEKTSRNWEKPVRLLGFRLQDLKNLRRSGAR